MQIISKTGSANVLSISGFIRLSFDDCLIDYLSRSNNDRPGDSEFDNLCLPINNGSK